MTDVKNDVKVNILDRDFMINCRDSERAEVLAAAAYLDQQMRLIQRSGKVFGIDRCAIMAALNITNEMLALKRTSTNNHDMASRIDALHEKIDGAMQTHSTSSVL